MHAPSPGRARLAKGATACQRCRRRKQKCDLKYPNCSNCEGAGVTCLTYLSGKDIEIPRDYVSNLEAELQRLVQENQNLRTTHSQEPISSREKITSLEVSPSVDQERNATPTESIDCNDNPQQLYHIDLVESVRNNVVEPSRQPRFLGPSSGITLAKMVLASINTNALPLASFSKPVSRASLNLGSSSSGTISSSTESSLPPRHAAEHLIDVYFQYRTPHLPLVERSQIETAMNNAYLYVNSPQPQDRTIERDIFTTYMVLAIALCNVPNPAGGTDRVTQSEGCFRSAIARAEGVIAYSPSDIEKLRAVLLLAQFTSMCPWQGSLWHLTGIALRLCVDIGLHWESAEQSLNISQDILYERRRLWYSAYHFDRVLAITLGRPFGIADEGIRVPLPNPWAVPRETLEPAMRDMDIHHQRAHNHLFNLLKLESEIKHVQSSQSWTLKLASPQPNFLLWLEDVKPRLQEWYSTIPEPAKAHPSSIFANQTYWDYMYYNAILLLYKPNPSHQILPKDAVFIAHDAARKVITSIKALQRKGRLDVLWKSVHHLFMAGLTVIYGLWQHTEIRDQGSVSSSIDTLQTCSTTLSAMSATFQGAAGCRDIFETLSSATIGQLVNRDDELLRQNRVEFDKQIEDFLQQLNPSRGDWSTTENGPNDLSTMLSTDAFSEMLSSAAQWHDYQMASTDMDSDSNGLWFPQTIGTAYV